MKINPARTDHRPSDLWDNCPECGRPAEGMKCAALVIAWVLLLLAGAFLLGRMSADIPRCPFCAVPRITQS